MDDRFDFILTSKAVIQNTDRIGYIPGSYEALGNDGRTPYNTELNCSGNTSVPSSICGNLKQASDHLPIVMDLMFGYPVGISQLDWATATVEIRYGSNGDSPTLFLDQSADISDVNISLFSIQGKQIWTTSKSAQAQMNVVLPIDGMPSGMYLVRVQNEKGQQKTLKVRM